MAGKAGAKQATKSTSNVGAAKPSSNDEIKIVLQVGSEFRVSNNGDVIISNPELELANDDRAADATLLYRFDAGSSEHTFRLIEPVADHAHTKVHRPND